MTSGDNIDENLPFLVADTLLYSSHYRERDCVIKHGPSTMAIQFSLKSNDLNSTERDFASNQGFHWVQ